MACTASLSLSSSTVPSGVPVQVQLVVSNGGSAEVDVTSIEPVFYGASSDVGPFITDVTPTTVPVSGSRTFSWSNAWFAGANGAGVTPGVTSGISAVVYLSDGTLCAASEVTLLVTPQSEFIPAVDGSLDFSDFNQSGLLAIFAAAI